MTILDDYASVSFILKFNYLQSKKDKDAIQYYVDWLCEQSDPDTLTGSVTCPNKKHKKIKIADNRCIIYECPNTKLFFVNFYLDQ